MKRYLTLVALVSLLSTALVAGCSSKPGPTAPPVKPPALNSPLSLASPLATPGDAETSSPEVVPEPDMGVVRGRMEQRGGDSSLEGQPLYLSGFVPLDDEQAGFEVVKIDRASDPRANVSADGSFVFASIEPGRYALAAVTPRGEDVLLLSLDTNREIIVEVKAGTVTDLGVIPVNLGF